MAGVGAGHPHRGVGGLDHREQKSWQNYLATVLRMTTMLNRHLIDAHQLSLVDVHLLEILDNAAGGTVQMGVLAEALSVPAPRLTRQIKRLGVRGLVLRTVSPDDRRCVLVAITTVGRTSLEQAMITYANQVRTHFLGQLTRPQMTAMATSCRQIGEALKQTGGTGR
ncbi:MarR family transcriptional regulator [Mycobacterium sp. SVM_VP21]|nr:MarR family transcriptional regulator [Mycobacterium sp. SVM_VP21]